MLLVAVIPHLTCLASTWVFHVKSWRMTRTSGRKLMCTLARQPWRRNSMLEKPSRAYMVANPTKDWTSCAIASSVRKCMFTSTAAVQVHTLSAAKNHSARLYYQVQESMGHRALDPQQWGCTLAEGRLDPTTMDLPAAPEDLLRTICWNSKTDCNCRRCTCRKMWLECSVVCGQCRGTSCSSSSEVEDEDIDDTDVFPMLKRTSQNLRTTVVLTCIDVLMIKII